MLGGVGLRGCKDGASSIIIWWSLASSYRYPPTQLQSFTSVQCPANLSSVWLDQCLVLLSMIKQ